MRTSIRSPFVACLLTLPVLTGCLMMSKKDGATVAQYPETSSNLLQVSGIGGEAGFEQTVYRYVTLNCVECHGASQSPMFAKAGDPKSDYNTILSRGLVDFGDISASIILQKTGDGHCGAN